MAVPNDPRSAHPSPPEPEAHDVLRPRTISLLDGDELATRAFMVGVPEGSRHDAFYARRGKRALDLAVGGVALVLALPILAFAALAVRVTMGGPVLFRQVRL